MQRAHAREGGDAGVAHGLADGGAGEAVGDEGFGAHLGGGGGVGVAQIFGLRVGQVFAAEAAALVGFAEPACCATRLTRLPGG
jgi:hypothetical protein